MKTKFAKPLCFFFLSFLLPMLSFAQLDDGTCDTCPAPIDSWLLILLIAGAAYGVLKYRKQRKMQ